MPATVVLTHPSTIPTIRCFARTGTGWATGDSRGVVRVWDAKGTQCGQASASTTSTMRWLFAASPDGREVLAGLRKITAFDATNAKKLRALAGQGDADVTGLVFGDGWLASSGKVNSNKQGNDVRIWSWPGGELTHKCKLPSRLRKVPCQVERLASAAGTSTLFAVGWSPRGADEKGTAPFARFVHRVDAVKGTAVSVLDLIAASEDENTPEVTALAATSDSLLVLRYDTMPTERWTLGRYTHEGTLTASVELPQDASLVCTADGTRVLVQGYESLGIYSLPELKLERTVALEAGHTESGAVLFDGDTSLAYLSIDQTQVLVAPLG